MMRRQGRRDVILCLFQQIFLMSANRLKNPKKRFDELFKKDLTPKSSKPLSKISPAYSSFRGGLTLKPDLTPKQHESGNQKIVRPSTSKYSSESQNYFKKSQEKKPNNLSSTKKYPKGSLSNSYEYKPRSKSKSPIKQPDQIIRQEIQVKCPKHVFLLREVKQYKNQHPPLPKILPPISNFEKAKHSLKPNASIKAYAASTNQGPVRDYNEDRVAIILNIAKPEHCTEWKKAAYFGVFDGHGGVDCADFLRDNLHVYVSREKSFPDRMQKALKDGFDKCQANFIEHSKNRKLDRSGSCAIVAFFYGGDMYVANVGDSRAIMSLRKGEIANELSIDHKASDDFEQKRIYEAGGKIYQTKLQNSNPNVKILYEGEEHSFILGPHRVMPGRLSVTRTFGDLEAKIPELGGNPKAIINDPEIKRISLSSDQDFILLASDGIFDKMSTNDVIQMVWETFRRDEGKFRNIHEFCGLAVENIMKLAFHKKTLDNITVVMVALEGLEKYFEEMNLTTLSADTSFNKTIIPESRRNKATTKLQSSFERKHIGRSTSPSNYSSLRSHSFYRN